MSITLEQKKELCNRIAALPKESRQALADQIGLPRMTTGHQISVINTLLVHWQGIESPTILGGFNQWRAVGRTVSEGQHAVYIRRPITKEDPNKKEDEESSADHTFFIFVPVFDVTQTEEYTGKAVSTATRTNGNGAPQVITAKFRSACHGCKAQIRKGDKIKYDRANKKVLCLVCSPETYDKVVKALTAGGEDSYLDEQYDGATYNPEFS